MSKVNKVKGFTDLYDRESAKFSFLEKTAEDVFGRYGYGEMRVPVLERTELFARSIGEETDVVQKEMYTFPDRRGRSLTMRPEATAGILRAYIENKLYAETGVSRMYATGPMFRYERPQKGRMRQFHQLDVEALGSPEPLLDAELILMLDQFLRAIGLTDLTFEINSLGCRECRPKYLEILSDFLKGMHKDHLCEDCMRRKMTNPLRVLDCKVPGCKEIVADAPKLGDHLCDACRDHFNVVLSALDAAGLSYALNPNLVRGLDYYVRTTFEVVSGDIGAQSSVAGGGRYDGLIASLGGPDQPGVGFACGMERLAMLLENVPEPSLDFFLVVLSKDDEALSKAFSIAQGLRAAGLRGETPFKTGGVKSQMRRAGKSGAKFCLVLGDDELSAGTIAAKDMAAGRQEVIPQGDLLQYLQNKL